DARHLHAALELAGAKAGKPVRFLPKYTPATGSRIAVSLRYENGGKAVTVPARDWVREHATGKPLATDWVFGGSKLVPNPGGAALPDYYVANYGDVICLCNMDSALLDLPVESPKKIDSRAYEAATAAIPEVGTKVRVIFEVVAETPRR
ncbi:MAG: YdjY domain-containing protein, partial [Gemmataceae bacterium]